MAKVLVTAQQRGSVNAVVGVVPILKSRGHTVEVYATGNDNEVAGFNGVGYKRIIDLNMEMARGIIKGYDVLVTGLSGHETADGYFIMAANQEGIKNIGVNDQDGNYVDRFGTSCDGLPTLIAQMNEGCLETMSRDLPEEMAKDAISRARVIGWTAYDSFSKMRDEFTDEKKLETLRSAGLKPDERVYFHATQNVPGTGHFGYEVRAAEEIMRLASDIGLKLSIKPHPREDGGRFSDTLAKRYGHNFIVANSCATSDLVLSSDVVTAGRSTVLNEACLLGVNTGGIFQPVMDRELGEKLEFYGDLWRSFPPISSGAIPYAIESEDIAGILRELSSEDKDVLNNLSENRKKFSVDGKASERLANLVDEVLN